MQSLEMEQAVVFNQSPNRKNISYAVQTITGGANKTFASCIEMLRQEADVHKYVDVWEPCIAVDILVAIHQILGDTDFVDNDYPSEEEEDVNLLSFNLSASEQDDEMFRNIPDEFFILAESSDSESDV
ncbi:hypothetical protein ACROYT_G002375 [Oculina patagonica]